MLSSVLASLMLLTMPVQPADTVIPVEPGTRLELVNLTGNVDVQVWDRDAVAIAVDRGLRDVASITRSLSVIRVRTAAGRAVPRAVDFSVTVPAWMPVRVNGMNSHVTLDGTEADVTVETVRGDIRLTGGNGRVTLRSVQGSIDVRDSRGRIDLYTVNDRIRVSGAAGDLNVETVTGSITLERIESGHVDASTVTGSLIYDGAIRDGGRYQFTTHNGSVTLRIPAGTSATVSVATMNGRFESDFPVTLAPGQVSSRFEFSIGTGSARIDLQSFNGSIRLARRGET